MKYVINFITALSTQSKLNAQSKARDDVNRTLNHLGYATINIYRINYPCPFRKSKNIPIISGLKEYISVFMKVRCIHKGDTVVLQDFREPQCQYLVKLCKKKLARVEYLVHDVYSIRFGEDTATDVMALNRADKLYVHTESMRDELIHLGVKTPMSIMHLFDYYSSDKQLPVKEIAKEKNTIIFAGNLRKSEFIGKLVNTKIEGSIKFRLYGFKGDLDLSKNPQIEYAGFFQPEHTASIHGGWGLVWDGDSLDTCSGYLGNYLRYNSSHKHSLYLCAGIPLILWSHSSLAGWVKENNVGICVDRLSDIPTIISNISDEKYREMITRAHAIGMKLRSGDFLKSIID